MKKVIYILLVCAAVLSAQFREELERPVDIKGKILTGEPTSLIAGFINPQNFTMSHSMSMSYTSFGSNGIALGVYTNSMRYDFSDKFNIEVDASVVNSPYSSYGDKFAEQINGIYLSRAQINYQPSENFKLMVQYRKAPYNYYGSPYGYYSRDNNWLFP